MILNYVRLSDVPMKLLRKFCSAKHYGISRLSVISKDSLLTKLLHDVPQAEDELQEWLQLVESEYTIESLATGGRRITRHLNNGKKRIYTEDATGSFGVVYT